MPLTKEQERKYWEMRAKFLCDEDQELLLKYGFGYLFTAASGAGAPTKPG
jgi:hypothetical protein